MNKCTLRCWPELKPNEYNIIYHAVDYTCDEIRENKDKMIEDYCNRHRSPFGSQKYYKDKSMQEYTKRLEDFLSQCKCHEEK